MAREEFSSCEDTGGNTKKQVRIQVQTTAAIAPTECVAIFQIINYMGEKTSKRSRDLLYVLVNQHFFRNV